MSNIPGVPEAERTCGNCAPRDLSLTGCPIGCSNSKAYWTERSVNIRARAEAIITGLKKRVVASDREVEQTLGKALGYAPLYPEASRVDDGQVNVGEHVPTTIAQAAANRIAELTRERDEAQVIVEKFEKLYFTRELDEEERERERDEQRGQLAAMREAIEDRGCDHGVIVKDACVKCHDKCPMGLAHTSDAGKPEADVIAAALDDFHPDALGDIAYDLDMTTGAEGHEDAILAYLKNLSTAKTVASLRGETR